jgi:hypothetical protein
MDCSLFLIRSVGGMALRGERAWSAVRVKDYIEQSQQKEYGIHHYGQTIPDNQHENVHDPPIE